MSVYLFCAVVLAFGIGIAYIITRSKASDLQFQISQAEQNLASEKRDAERRESELRTMMDELRGREKEATNRADQSRQRAESLSSELMTALEEKGRFQSEAARVEETRSILVQREAQIEALSSHVANLEREKAEALKDVEAARQRAKELISTEHETQQRIVQAKDEQIAKLEEFIAQARTVLTTEFKALSADALKQTAEQLVQTTDGLIAKHGEKTVADVKLHQQRIETMLKPVEETIKRLDKHVEETDAARGRAQAVLDDHVKQLATASESLTNALRKPVVRGSWGEMTLENALENAGLQAEIDFILQHTTDDEDGKKRTDAVINLPKGRKLIIDSKNLMETFIALANAQDENERNLLTEAHSKSLKNHIRSLSSREYWNRYEGLDCVILFIPHDGMYHAAIRDEAELIRDASDKRVFISNPMTLIPLLKAIRYVLDQEKANESAEDIKNVAADLYYELARFAGNFAKVGDRIKSAVSAYNDAIPGLDRYIISKARSLKQLGTAKGEVPELPESIEVEPRLFASPELRDSSAEVLPIQWDKPKSL